MSDNFKDYLLLPLGKNIECPYCYNNLYLAEAVHLCSIDLTCLCNTTFSYYARNKQDIKLQMAKIRISDNFLIEIDTFKDVISLISIDNKKICAVIPLDVNDSLIFKDVKHKLFTMANFK